MDEKVSLFYSDEKSQLSLWKTWLLCSSNVGKSLRCYFLRNIVCRASTCLYLCCSGRNVGNGCTIWKRIKNVVTFWECYNWIKDFRRDLWMVSAPGRTMWMICPRYFTLSMKRQHFPKLGETPVFCSDDSGMSTLCRQMSNNFGNKIT